MLIINAPYLAVQTWSVVKRWLDPRTQSKIEILGTGPETITKLQELVPLEYLPTQYGGMVENYFKVKDNVEALPVPRNGKLIKEFTVPAKKKFSIDSYVSEGQIDIMVTFMTVGMRSSTGLAPPVSIKPGSSPEDGPARNLQEFPDYDEERQITVTWTNPSRFSSRPLVYVFNIIENDVEEETHKEKVLDVASET